MVLLNYVLAVTILFSIVGTGAVSFYGAIRLQNELGSCEETIALWSFQTIVLMMGALSLCLEDNFQRIWKALTEPRQIGHVSIENLEMDNSA
jgi:hypothetical protein